MFFIKNLEKSFNCKQVFDKLSLQIKKGKITAFIGPNGCGKTTLFNVLAGLIKSDGGDLKISSFNKFKFSYAFQNYRETLLPWRTNRGNLIFPLQIQKFSGEKIEQRLNEIMKFACFDLNLKRYPYELSGGQQQILAFLRILITKPEVLLLDEPFSALDYDNSLKMLDSLQEYYMQSKATSLIITHNIEEALYIADEVVVFSDSPSKVLGIVENKLPRPRNLETIKSEEFHKIKSEVLELFKQARQDEK
jgi:NitT/TauT family transport system ATP-binding protein